MKTKNHTGISPDTLKYIAIVTMLIDHVTYGILGRMILTSTNVAIVDRLTAISSILRGIGRLAFPIFAYQLVQGFIYTKSRRKYAVTLLIFGLLSELPFDLYFFNNILYTKHQNVMFEFLIGIAMLSVIEYVNRELFEVDFAYDTDVWALNKAMLTKAVCSDIIITVVFALTAQTQHFDYGAKGMILISSIYILYNNREIMSFLSPTLFIISFYFVSVFFNASTREQALSAVRGELPAYIAFFLIYFDNGIRKIKGRRKYIFYAFYPVHLLILKLITLLV